MNVVTTTGCRACETRLSRDRCLAHHATLAQDRPKLAEQLRTLPDRPGVYLFKDGRGRLLYVGKAESLRDRVRSYFQTSTQLRSAHSRSCADDAPGRSRSSTS